MAYIWEKPCGNCGNDRWPPSKMAIQMTLVAIPSKSRLPMLALMPCQVHILKVVALWPNRKENTQGARLLPCLPPLDLSWPQESCCRDFHIVCDRAWKSQVPCTSLVEAVGVVSFRAYRCMQGSYSAKCRWVQTYNILLLQNSNEIALGVSEKPRYQTKSCTFKVLMSALHSQLFRDVIIFLIPQSTVCFTQKIKQLAAPLVCIYKAPALCSPLPRHSTAALRWGFQKKQ